MEQRVRGGEFGGGTPSLPESSKGHKGHFGSGGVTERTDTKG